MNGTPMDKPDTDLSELRAERKAREEQAKAKIFEILQQTGEKDKMKNLLKKRLDECGWRDELKKYTKEVIKSKGIENITVEELVKDITPKGRETVPDDVKAELLQKIREFIEAHVD